MTGPGRVPLAAAIAGLTITMAATLSATMSVAPARAEEDLAARTATTGEVNDPLEGLNRVTSAFNRVLRQWIIDPFIDGYQAITPDEVQLAISNVASNLTEPVTIVSSLIQGDFDNAGVATQRFLINTTSGIGGIRDPASEIGLEQRREDVGQALGAHGVSPGPHLVLPILGPSNFRDAVGDIATALASPLPFAGKAAAAGVEYSDNQQTIRAISDDAIDPYIAERGAYERNREFVVDNGRRVEVPDIPEMD